MGNWLKMNPSTLVLARGELASFQPTDRICRVSCMAGRLWVTGSGTPEDFVLAPGEEVIFTGRGTVVVQALRRATVRLDVRRRAPAPVAEPFPGGRPTARLVA